MSSLVNCIPVLKESKYLSASLNFLAVEDLVSFCLKVYSVFAPEIIVNLGLLGFFKYYNFFLENFVNTFTLFGGELRYNSLYIILPVGISFYTFQTLSYTIDVYRGKFKPVSSFLDYCFFLSFFIKLTLFMFEVVLRLGHVIL